MNQWLNNASSGLKRSRLAGACRILPCIFGADIGAQLGHNLNQFVTSVIGDRVGDEVLQATPTLAAMGGGAFDPNSIVNQLLPSSVRSHTASEPGVGPASETICRPHHRCDQPIGLLPMSSIARWSSVGASFLRNTSWSM